MDFKGDFDEYCREIDALKNQKLKIRPVPDTFLTTMDMDDDMDVDEA
jgi:hypothetical protein